jgi:heparanase 1
MDSFRFLRAEPTVEAPAGGSHGTRAGVRLLGRHPLGAAPALDRPRGAGPQPTCSIGPREAPWGLPPPASAWPISSSTSIARSFPSRGSLAAALGPAYLRVSGTWANTTFLPAAEPPPEAPPAGFRAVLTHRQWRGVVEFARAVDARIVTSFAACAGARGPEGGWAPEQARRLFELTRSAGGTIAAAELMNEPSLAAIGGAPPGYDAAAYGRDFRAFVAFARREAPELAVLGPGSVGETDGAWDATRGRTGFLRTRELLAAAGRGVDAFSYHHYGAISRRGADLGILQTTPDEALSEAWLARTDETLSFYRRLRDELEPGVPLWLTETADAACGGNPWASTFLDTFRYLDQLGRLARQSVQVVAHNTLAASDYGLLDERTLAPRPSYWGALLWRRLMGTVVLDAGVPIQHGLHVYAHSLRGAPDGVALLVINNDREAARSLRLPTTAERFTLSSPRLDGREVLLNGTVLGLGRDGAPPGLRGIRTDAGVLTFAPATITFLAVGGVRPVREEPQNSQRRPR